MPLISLIHHTTRHAGHCSSPTVRVPTLPLPIVSPIDANTFQPTPRILSPPHNETPPSETRPILHLLLAQLSANPRPHRLQPSLIDPLNLSHPDHIPSTQRPAPSAPRPVPQPRQPLQRTEQTAAAMDSQTIRQVVPPQGRADRGDPATEVQGSVQVDESEAGGTVQMFAVLRGLGVRGE